MLKRLVPFINYKDVTTGINFFVGKLGFKIIYTEGEPITTSIVERDNVQLFLQKNSHDVDPYEPAYRVEVVDIDDLYEEIKERGHDAIHPNTDGISKMPWGAKEFAVLDPIANTCITFYEYKSG